MDANKQFAELVGGTWHGEQSNCDGMIKCICGYVGFSYGFEEHCDRCNSDYAADPRLVLREMERIGKFKEFVAWLVNKLHHETGNSCIALAELFKDTTGKLRDAAIKWLEKEEGK